MYMQMFLTKPREFFFFFLFVWLLNEGILRFEVTSTFGLRRIRLHFLYSTQLIKTKIKKDGKY